MKNIGLRIRTLREEHGWSQIELSEKININNSVMSRIESGKRPVEDELIVRFADAFGVTTDYLLGKSIVRSPIDTIAAHHDGDEFTEEELEDIEKFKEFVRSKRKQDSKK